MKTEKKRNKKKNRKYLFCESKSAFIVDFLIKIKKKKSNCCDPYY